MRLSLPLSIVPGFLDHRSHNTGLSVNPQLSWLFNQHNISDGDILTLGVAESCHHPRKTHPGGIRPVVVHFICFICCVFIRPISKLHYFHVKNSLSFSAGSVESISAANAPQI